MKLIRLQLYNFRQFYGKSPAIKFAVKSQKNVTLFLGDNGSGKTTLLNAFIWILYNKHTSGFIQPIEIVNKRAIFEAEPETTIEAWGELEFEHNDYQYLIKRVTKAYKKDALHWEDNSESNVKLNVRGPDGITYTKENVLDIIGKVLPVDLHSYFFFDGERIEKIVKQDKKEKAALADATKKLLNLEVIYRGIRHLNDAVKEFERELKRIGDAETQQLLEQKEKTEKQVKELQIELNTYSGNLEAYENNKEEIENKLRKIKDSENLQKRRDELHEKLDYIMGEKNSNHAYLKKIIAENSFSIFLKKYYHKYNTIVEDMRIKGDLPAGIKQQFVNDLLQEKLCICGRCLDQEKDNDAYEAVTKWLRKAGIGDVEEKIYTLSAHVKQVPEKLKAFWENMDTCQHKEDNYRLIIAEIENELDEIEKEMLESPKGEVSKLQKRLLKVEENINEAKRNIWKTEESIKERYKEIDDLEDEIQEHELLEESQKLVKKRLSAAIDAENRLRSTYNLCDDSLRNRLQIKINDIFEQISITPYKVKLDNEYALSLHDQTGTIARSQGESQILSLSFIAGIIELVREWNLPKNSNKKSDDVAYPVIMDSPFGTLDQTNRPGVVKHINKIADQVVMMLSSTQWRNEVEYASKNNIGKIYILKYYTPKEKFKNKISIVYNGKNYTLVQKSPSDYEYTEIIEANHG